MNRPIVSFADVIAPVPQERFFVESWETQPLQIRRRQPDYYQHLLTKQDVDRAIATQGLRFPAIQLAKGGRFLPAEAFTHTIRSGADVFTGVPDLDRLRAEYNLGATISMPGFHRAWAPLGQLAAAIEDAFSHAVHTNVYLTPGNAAGFTPHFDTHEVFILQIAGAKCWTIYPPPVVLPHRSQSFDAAPATSSKPILELDLAPGDLLYLPRGFVHSTATSSRFSVHVTLGITVYNWVDVLTEWAQSSKHGLAFRRALPPGFAKDAGMLERLKGELTRLMTELERSTDYDALLGSFLHRVRQARTVPRGDFDADAVAPTSQAEKYP